MKQTTMALVLLALGVLPATAGQARHVRVWSGNMQGWVFVNETGRDCSTPDCELQIVAQSVAGDGSARLALSDIQDPLRRSMLFAPLGRGQQLRQLRALSYSAYVWDITSSPYTPAVAIPIDFDLTDKDNAWQGRMIFNPAWHPSFVDVREEWRTFDAVQGRLAQWYFEDVPFGMTNYCVADNPCTLDEIIDRYPHAGIHRTFGGIEIYVGQWGLQHLATSVDLITVGMKGKTRIYDFEPGGPETYKECKDDGWVGFYDNQQHCMQTLKHPAPAPTGQDDDEDGGLAPTSYKECKYNGWVGYYASQEACVNAFK